MKSVTTYINDAHLEHNFTIGNPANIPLFGSPLTPSLNFSSAYAFHSIADIGQYHDDKYNSIRYTRDSSLIVRQLEAYFELFHDGHKALLFNSGMSAISAAINTLVAKDSIIITFDSYYRKTCSIIESLSKKFGVKHVHFQDFDDYHANYQSGANDLFFLESPSNPFLSLIDIETIRKDNPQAKIIMDATFQGLLNDKGMLKYSDLTIMSCTKYIGGHNDILAGLVICFNPDIYAGVWNERSMRGGIIDNMSSYLLLRSLRTYDIRIEKSLANVEKILGFLENEPLVEKIYYPGRYQNTNQVTIFDKSHYHGGSVVTFEVNGDVSLERNIEAVCSIKMAPSFGSLDSLIEIPAYMSHWEKSEQELQKIGLNRRIIRLSIGMEPVEYLLNDLRKLLYGVEAVSAC